MKQNKKIAVTGGIGSGKTLFCNILKNMGCEVFSCDEIYGELLHEEGYLSLLRARFPDCFSGGKLDKSLLSKRVFSSREERSALESLAHPMIMERLLKKMEGKELAFAEVPLLFEGGYEGLFDYVVALVRNREERVKAVMKRSGLTEKEILSRMENQFDPALLSYKNCLIVENDGSEEELKEKAQKLLQILRSEEIR
ncbi:MAG: dephospho-CoA kinase [Clostridia bacterium]|nr:dephospho-CoA kinase [Clostridia bacterium]